MAGAVVAKRLYYDSPALEFPAQVTDIRLVATEQDETGARSHVWQMALDRTAFYPESGGQPWDTGLLIATSRSGAMLEVPVERVVEDETGEIWHQIRKPLEQGTAIVGHVHAGRRMDHMQQHSGQHLLSAVFLQRLGARTVSFHLGAESATIDLVLPEGVAGLTLERMGEAEDEVNRLIFENRPLTPRWYSREEAERMLARGDLRKLPERSGPMRVVEIQGVEFNACGGTHVASTGAIGGLLLRGTEKVKSGVRAEFACGLRAARAARGEHVLLSGVAGALSVAVAQVPARIAALQEEAGAAAKRIRSLQQDSAKYFASGLVRQGGPVMPILQSGDIEYAKMVARECVRLGARALVTAQGESETGVILARSPEDVFHAGDLVRRVLSEVGARGGGSAEIGQGRGTTEQMKHIVDRFAAEWARLATPGEGNGSSR